MARDIVGEELGGGGEGWWVVLCDGGGLVVESIGFGAGAGEGEVWCGVMFYCGVVESLMHYCGVDSLIYGVGLLREVAEEENIQVRAGCIYKTIKFVCGAQHA